MRMLPPHRVRVLFAAVLVGVIMALGSPSPCFGIGRAASHLAFGTNGVGFGGNDYATTELFPSGITCGRDLSGAKQSIFGVSDRGSPNGHLCLRPQCHHRLPRPAQ